MIDWLVDLSRLNGGVPTRGALGAYAHRQENMQIFHFSIIYAYFVANRQTWSLKYLPMLLHPASGVARISCEEGHARTSLRENNFMLISILAINSDN